MKRQPLPQPKIGLDELLTGTPSIADVSEFWQKGEFYEERYLVAAIKKHLLTPEQAAKMAAMGVTIEDMLNGRIGAADNDGIVDEIFGQWNEKLGFRSFGA